MRYKTRVLLCFASVVCAGVLGVQVERAALGAQAQGDRCPDGTLAVLPEPRPLAPLLNDNSPARVPGSYMVVFQPNTPPMIKATTERVRNIVGPDAEVRAYERAILGYSVRFPAQQLVQGQQLSDAQLAQLNQLRQLPCVAYVERNLRATFNAQQARRKDVPRGLDRIDRQPPQPQQPPSPLLDNEYIPFPDGKGDGKDVHVYLIDSGIDKARGTFAGRLSWDYSVECYNGEPDLNDPPRRPCDRNNDEALYDCNGHGTAVAGVIGGRVFGVADNVTFHSVRVADQRCELHTDNLIRGIEWVMADVPYSASNEKRVPRGTPYLAVANMSLSVGPGRHSGLDEAVAKLIETAGIAFVASAGNRHLDACGFSPGGGALKTITVGAMQIEGENNLLTDRGKADGEASFTNFGPCIDIFAPGVAIDTAVAKGPPWCQGEAPPKKREMLCAGTSVAAAHVSGCIALYLQSVAGRGANMRTPEAIWTWLSKRATSDGIKSGERVPVTVQRLKGQFEYAPFKDAAGRVVPILPTETPPGTDISIRHPGTTNALLYCGP